MKTISFSRRTRIVIAVITTPIALFYAYMALVLFSSLFGESASVGNIILGVCIITVMLFHVAVVVANTVRQEKKLLTNLTLLLLAIELMWYVFPLPLYFVDQ